MKARWDEKSYQWFVDSWEYTGYETKLGEILLNLIGDRSQDGFGTLCDMGCGAATIDMALSPYFSKLTCVDVSESVISCVQREITKRALDNITAICEDGTRVTGKWDTVIALNHARNLETIRHYLSLAVSRLVLVVRASRMTETGLNTYRRLDCYDSNSMQEELDRAGITYRFMPLSIEHGQPFRTRNDAMQYTMLYCGMKDPAAAELYLNAKLQSTEDEKFPFYLPKEKHLGLFLLEQQQENKELQ